ncbi:MAG: SH3 domain-containing protein [Candidatus Aminicenantes bacterium]|nr:SH3 domain-containing protein [Candidatus Aminicenantes bacterium]
MKRDIIAFLMIAIILWLPLALLGQEAQQRLKVKSGTAFIRLRPDSKSQAIGRVSLGTVLDVLSKEGEWYRINLPLRRGGMLLSGYIHQSRVVEVKGKEKDSLPKSRLVTGTATEYTGEKVTVRFKDADVRDVIMYLCKVGGLNVVFHPEVKGNVTLDLKDVPWDQALDLVLKLNRLGKVVERNVLRTGQPKVLIEEFRDKKK